MKESLKNFGKHILWGLVVILGGLFLYLITVMTLGYLPYSDRPGPGWYKEKISLSWEEVNYVWGFIAFLGLYVLAVLIIVYFLFRLFRLLGYNRLVFAILGGLILGFLSFYLTLGIGWYIAIDVSTVYMGGLLGLLYGSTLFPKYLRPIVRTPIT